MGSGSKLDRCTHEYMGTVEDILSHPDLRLLEGMSNHGSTDLMEHSLNVSTTSFRLCRGMGLDHRSAARAGLLHDLYMYDWRKGEGPPLHGLRHGRIALEESRKRFSLSGKEEDAILHHMWPLTPVPPTSPEGLVVCLLDKYQALREILIVEKPISEEVVGKTSGSPSPGNGNSFRNHMKDVLIIASRFKALLTG